MNPEAASLTIKRHLLTLGWGVIDLAHQLGTSRSMASQVINGHSENPAMRRKIAAWMGTSYLDLWGVDDPGVDHLPPGRPGGRKCLTPVNDLSDHPVPAEVSDV